MKCQSGSDHGPAARATIKNVAWFDYSIISCGRSGFFYSCPGTCERCFGAGVIAAILGSDLQFIIALSGND